MAWRKNNPVLQALGMGALYMPFLYLVNNSLIKSPYNSLQFNVPSVSSWGLDCLTLKVLDVPSLGSHRTYTYHYIYPCSAVMLKLVTLHHGEHFAMSGDPFGW